MRTLWTYNIILTVVVCFLLLKTFNNPQIIRVQGIIIEDASGNERILIGAPIPYAKNRIRTDTSRVKEEWGRFFPENYLDYYKNYNHNTDGILILDENGHDRLALGSSVPDPNIGPRIGSANGIILNDYRGFERSGYSLINVNGRDRVVIGLDNLNGTEGVSIGLFEDGTAGMTIGGQDKSIFLGKADSTYGYDGNKHFNGLRIQQTDTDEIILNSEN